MTCHPTNKVWQSSIFRRQLPLLGVLLVMSLVSTSVAADRPNIVIILADDLGYGSLNSYGADEAHIRKPNIDRLAKEGRRFIDANTPSWSFTAPMATLRFAKAVGSTSKASPAQR